MGLTFAGTSLGGAAMIVCDSLWGVRRDVLGAALATYACLPLNRRSRDCRPRSREVSSHFQICRRSIAEADKNYARDLYDSILTKRIEVVGRRDLRDQIVQTADQWKPVQI